VAGLVEVAGRVLSLRRVATSDVAAGKAHAQVNPAAAGPQAFLAPVGDRRDRVDLVQVRAGGGHACTCAWEGDVESEGVEIFMAWVSCASASGEPCMWKRFMAFLRCACAGLLCSQQGMPSTRRVAVLLVGFTRGHRADVSLSRARTDGKCTPHYSRLGELTPVIFVAAGGMQPVVISLE
jgi:hypothetical protein